MEADDLLAQSGPKEITRKKREKVQPVERNPLEREDYENEKMYSIRVFIINELIEVAKTQTEEEYTSEEGINKLSKMIINKLFYGVTYDDLYEDILAILLSHSENLRWLSDRWGASKKSGRAS